MKKITKKILFITVLVFAFFALGSSVHAQSAPTVTIIAGDSDLGYGESTDIYWYPHNATSCIASGGSSGWPGSKYYHSSSFYTGPLYQTATYEITCSNAYGSGSNSVTVYVGSGPVTFPTVNLSVDNVDMPYNGTTTIRWSTTNANSCDGSGGANGWSGSKSIPSGTFNTGNVVYTTTYTLTCTNSSGSDSKSVTINVSNQNNIQPTVSTSNATNISYYNATLNGYISANGGNNVNAYFQWGPNGNLYNQTNKVNYGGTSGSNYTYLLSGLTPNTTYSFRAVAENTNGQVVYGNQINFTTTSSYGGCTYNCGINIPSVTTYSATNITDTYATLNGYVNANQSSVTRWFEWGTSTGNLYNQTTKIYQGTTSGNISHSLTGLSPNSTYYFRAVAQSQAGGTYYGNVISFNTTNSNYYYNPNSCSVNISCVPQAVTTLATNIDQNSARLNGLGIVSNALGSVSNTGYFEWGTTQSLGNTTTSGFIGSTDSNPFYASLFSLTSGTTYYYRAVVNNQYGTSRGEIVSFRTNNAVVVTNPPVNTVTNVVYRDRVVVTNTNNSDTSKSSLVFLNIENNGSTVTKGTQANYVVRYKNVSAKNLKDVVLTVLFPKELQFSEANRGYFSPENNTVVVNIGDLYPEEEGSVTIRVNVGEGADAGKIIVVTAHLAYTVAVDDSQEEVFAYSKNEVLAFTTSTNNTKSDNALSGAAIFGGGFWPSTLVGWLFLILIIVLIIFAIRRSAGNNKPKFMPIASNRNGDYKKGPGNEGFN